MLNRIFIVSLGLLSLGGCVVIPIPIQSNTPPVTISSNSNPDLNQIEQEVYQQVNQYRQSQNLPPLQPNATITKQARLHSEAMAEGSVSFSHQGFDNRVKAIAQTISYRSAAENLASNQGYSNPAEAAVQGWIESEGHRRNMIGNYNVTGVGVAQNEAGEYYFTQIFIQSR